MTNQEILEKAIQKAIEGGWGEAEYARSVAFAFPEGKLVRSFLFDHDFAKALWETEEHRALELMISNSDGTERANRLMTHLGWRLHLQQMVVAENPIKYLGENV